MAVTIASTGGGAQTCTAALLGIRWPEGDAPSIVPGGGAHSACTHQVPRSMSFQVVEVDSCCWPFQSLPYDSSGSCEGINEVFVGTRLTQGDQGRG